MLVVFCLVLVKVECKRISPKASPSPRSRADDSALPRFGGIILYLSMFYKRHDLMFRLGVFYCAAPLSGAFGGLLATGLAQIHYHGYNSWPWIFFVEGAITVLVAITAFFFLPNTPGAAKFLTKEEQVFAARRLRIDLHGATSSERVEEEKFNWREV